MSCPVSPERSKDTSSRGGSLRGSLEYSREAGMFPELLVLQPSAIVDHIAVSSRIEEHVDGEIGKIFYAL